MGAPLEQLVYVSRSVAGVNSAIEMSDILAQARPNNLRDKITGCLTVIDGRFVQIIEGEADNLDDLMQRLLNDERHVDLRVLERRTVAERSFPGWEMLSPVLIADEIDNLRRLTRDDIPCGLDDFIEPFKAALKRQNDFLSDSKAG